MPEFDHDPVRSRNDIFADRIPTRIWQEQPSPDNPYIATAARCHGYDLVELMTRSSFVDAFYLLFRGELPGSAQAQLLEQLMIALINPGPRHSATRAAMNAGIGKTEAVHILPIALGVLGGEHAGAGQIEAGMRFLHRAVRRDPEEEAKRILAASDVETIDTYSTQKIFAASPGFGRHCGGVDVLTQTLADKLVSLEGAGEALAWGHIFAKALTPANAGWLPTGLAAAAFFDLGFQPRMGASLFQLLSAPGLAAHGVEMSNKPITAMPFVKDEMYVIEK